MSDTIDEIYDQNGNKIDILETSPDSDKPKETDKDMMEAKINAHGEHVKSAAKP